MATIGGLQLNGPMGAHLMRKPWDTGERVCVEAADARIYMTAAEALALRDRLSAVLEDLVEREARVTAALTDESEEGSPQ